MAGFAVFMNGRFWVFTEDVVGIILGIVALLVMALIVFVTYHWVYFKCL